MSLRWDFCTLADQLGKIIEQSEADLRLEQAVYGLDAKDERELQELLTQDSPASRWFHAFWPGRANE